MTPFEIPSPANPPTGADALPADRSNLDPLTILNSIGEALYRWDLATDVLGWSPNAAAILHLDDTARIDSGRAFHECTAAVSACSRRDAILSDTRSDSGAGVPYQIRYGLSTTVAGRPEIVWVDDTGRWFAGEGGRPAQAHGLIRVSNPRATGDSLSHPVPDTDPLTGCLSRARLLHTLGATLASASAKRATFGLLLIGIDDLEPLNRQHGYDAVDELLAGLAKALRTQTRGADCLARYAGNKFALLLSGCDAKQIAPAAARALDVLTAAPIATSAGPLAAAVRIGGVLAPRHGRTARALLSHAEAALEGARGSERFRLFDPAAQADDEERRWRDTADEIVAALIAGRVRIALQPIVKPRTGDVVMNEALLRIVLDDGGVLEPPSLLPAADKAGLTAMLDRRVLDLAVAHLQQTRGMVSMNLSTMTLRDPTWPTHVAAVLRLNPGMATRLVFEIAEEAAIAAGTDVLATFASLGVRIAIDHFGAGHASVRALRQIKPDFLKIDGAFVQNLARSPDDRFVVRSLLAVARQIGAPVIAEWVESAATAATLVRWGVPLMQGAHFGLAELPPSRENAVSLARSA